NTTPIVLFAILSIVSVISISSLEASSKWVNHTHEVIGAAMKIEAAAVDMETGMRGFMLAGKDEFLEPYDGGGARFSKLVTALQKKVSDNPSQVKLLDEIRSTIGEWKSKITEPAIAFRREVGKSKTMNEVASLVGEARGKKYFDKFRSQMNTFKEREQSLMGARQEQSQKDANNATFVIEIGSLSVIILSFFISYIFAKYLSRELEERSTSLIETSVELKGLGGSIEGKSNSFSQSVNDQSSNITEVSASLEEISKLIQRTAENAQNSAILAKDSQTQVEKGKASIDNINNEIGGISLAAKELSQNNAETAEEMREITSIIKSIEVKTSIISDIVAQTKLLSFNASIEAARAGEHGKGFSIVAQEIGNLAKVSGEASDEISKLLGTSISRVDSMLTSSKQKSTSITNQIESKIESGQSQSELTSKNFEDTVTSFRNVNTTVGDIAEAAKEQSIGVQQIFEAIQNLTGQIQNTSENSNVLLNESTTLIQHSEKLNLLVEGIDIFVAGSNSSRNQSRINTSSSKVRLSSVSATVESVEEKTMDKKSA
ncbi:CHASE3 domain-containing protein, partial [bacterium]|nr:CHASE3 domain-containing protein [bacterium]